MRELCPDWSESEVRRFVHEHYPDQEHINRLTSDDEWHAGWAHWRRQNPDVIPRLAGAQLQNRSLQDAALYHARLGSANFRHSDLYKADLSHAYCEYADFRNARLCEATLGEGDFSYAVFNECDCSEADMRKANLYGAAFYSTNLLKADLRGANVDSAVFNGANLSGANLSGLDFRGVGLEKSILVGTNLQNANLTGCHVYGISVWDVNLDGTVQQELIIAPEDEPAISVDNLEVAQFIYLLLNNQKIRHVIDTITSKVVLILGRFTPERKAILDAIRDELRTRDYVPALLDFEKPSSKTTLETVTTLARMARFVVADLTDAKSVLQELQAVVPANPSVPIQPVILNSQTEPGMFDFFKMYPWVLEPFQYKDQDGLLAAITDNVIGPAEAKAKEQTGP